MAEPLLEAVAATADVDNCARVPVKDMSRRRRIPLEETVLLQVLTGSGTLDDVLGAGHGRLSVDRPTVLRSC